MISVWADLDSDPDHDAEPGFFKRNFSIEGYGQC